MSKRDYDYLVLGSGIAGLFFALKVAERGRVAIVTKKDRAESNTLTRARIQAALDKHNGRQSDVWKELGLSSRHQLARLIKKHGVVVRKQG